MKHRIWVTTDTHLGHKQMVTYCGRPENHSELILEGLRKNLREGDVLIHLGDVCIGNDEAWHHDLAGYIPKDVKRFLLLGNHDSKSVNWYLNHGWDWVGESFSGTYFGKKVTFSHIPIEGIKSLNIHGHFHNTLHRLLRKEYVIEGEKERNDKDFDLDKYDTNVYKLLAIENTNYQPVTLESLLA